MRKYLAVLVMLLAACQAEIIHLAETDNGKEIKAHAGQEISVSLPGNITTGYNWQFMAEGNSDGVYKEIENQYRADDVQQGMVGSGGVSIYRMKLLKPGKVKLTARYYRPWQKFNPETDKSIEIFITVE